MWLLVEMKPLTVIWRLGAYPSWEALLRGEKVCSVPYFNDFERATRLFKKSTISVIGADAAVILARVEEPLQIPVLGNIKRHIDTHKVAPSGPTIWAWVRALRYLPVISKGKAKMGQHASRIRH